MATNLELSIYTFTLKEKNSREDFLDFNEFYRKNFSLDGENPHSVEPKLLYKRFVGMILDEFENKFWLNSEKNKGISTRDIDFRPSKSVIEGIINGGNTGYGHQIFNILDNEVTVGEISKDQLASLPYYFKIWTLIYSRRQWMTRPFTARNVLSLAQCWRLLSPQRSP